jgi:uncharacterized membrane protein YkvA (DUF1232 family)
MTMMTTEDPMTEIPTTDIPADVDLEELRAENVTHERAERFYDRVRNRIQRYVESKGVAVEKSAEFLLLVPDVFILLWRLVNDRRVSGKSKVLLGSGIAYYIFPIDLIPEAFVGPIGYLDDLVFAVFILNRILGDTDAELLRAHWPGSDDVLAMIQKVLGAAESLVGTPMVERIKKMAK